MGKRPLGKRGIQRQLLRRPEQRKWWPIQQLIQCKQCTYSKVIQLTHLHVESGEVVCSTVSELINRLLWLRILYTDLVLKGTHAQTGAAPIFTRTPTILQCLRLNLSEESPVLSLSSRSSLSTSKMVQILRLSANRQAALVLKNATPAVNGIGVFF